MPRQTLYERPHDIIAIARRYANSKDNNNQTSPDNNNNNRTSAKYPNSHYEPREIHSDDEEYNADYMVNRRKKFNVVLCGSHQQQPSNQNHQQSENNTSTASPKKTLPPIDDGQEQKLDANDDDQKDRNAADTTTTTQKHKNKTLLSASPPTQKRRHSYSTYNESSPVPSMAHKYRERYVDEFGVVTANPVVKRDEETHLDETRYNRIDHHNRNNDHDHDHHNDDTKSTNKKKKTKKTAQSSPSPANIYSSRTSSSKKLKTASPRKTWDTNNNNNNKAKDDPLPPSSGGPTTTTRTGSEIDQNSPQSRKRRNSTHQAVGLYSAAPIKHRITETLAVSHYNAPPEENNNNKASARRKSVSVVGEQNATKSGPDNQENSLSNNETSTRRKSVSLVEQKQEEKPKDKKKSPSPEQSSSARKVSPKTIQGASKKPPAASNVQSKKESLTVTVTPSATTAPPPPIPSSETTTLTPSSKPLALAANNNIKKKTVKSKINTGLSKTRAANAVAEAAVASYDLSNVRSYLNIDDDNKVTPEEVRHLLEHLQPSALLAHWNHAIGKASETQDPHFEDDDMFDYENVPGYPKDSCSYFYDKTIEERKKIIRDDRKRKNTPFIPRYIEYHRSNPSSPLYLISNWIHGKGSEAEHQDLMNSRSCRGVAVMSDAAGLSKLSKTKPMLEVLKHIHEPKTIVAEEVIGFVNLDRKNRPELQRKFDELRREELEARIGKLRAVVDSSESTEQEKREAQTWLQFEAHQNGEYQKYAYKPPPPLPWERFKYDGNFIGNWVADNTASFYPFVPSPGFDSKSDEEQKKEEEEFLNTIVNMMIRAQKKISKSCLVKIGMACHFGTYTVLGSPENSRHVLLQGHEYEHCEHLAEDFTAGGEIVVTEDNWTKYYNKNNNDNKERNKERGFGVISRGEEGGDEGEMKGFRIIPNEETKSDNNDNEDPGDFDLDDDGKNQEQSSTNKNKSIFYPAGLSPDFFRFLNKYPADEIVSHHAEVDNLKSSGIYLLVKFRSVEQDLLLDQIAQRMYVREEVKMIVDRIQQTAAEKDVYHSPGSVTLVKCNGDIAIVRAENNNAALRFAFCVEERFEKLGQSFQCSIGAWKGEAFIFDLTYEIDYDSWPHRRYGFRPVKIHDYDIAGAPVNIASKLAEDFGEDGVFFGSDIFDVPSPDSDDDDDDSEEDDDGENTETKKKKKKKIVVDRYQKVIVSAADEKEIEKQIRENPKSVESKRLQKQSKSVQATVLGDPVKIVKSGVTIHAFKLTNFIDKTHYHMPQRK